MYVLGSEKFSEAVNLLADSYKGKPLMDQHRARIHETVSETAPQNYEIRA
jgi:hypothetical protein